VHEFLSGKTWSPLLPRVPEPPLVLELEVEPPDDDLARLSFGLKAVLQRALSRLRAEQHAVTALELQLSLERGGQRRERLVAAAPTLDAVQLVELIRLRLSSGNADLGGKVAYLTLQLEHLRVHPRQLMLVSGANLAEGGTKTRDLEAAGRAIARLRASLGAQAVTRARLREAQLPEASFRFEPVAELTAPRELHPPSDPPLVRRVYRKPVPLDSPESHEPERWLGTHGAVRTMHGPYRIAGGWWSPHGARERDYCFVETQTGELLWLYYDRGRRRWLMHGAVE
jgi:protein ImuB